MEYVIERSVEEGRYRGADRLIVSLKSTRREMRAERRKVCRPHL